MKGITASMMREASYSSMRLGLYDVFKGVYAPGVRSKEDFTLTQKILGKNRSDAGEGIAECIVMYNSNSDSSIVT